MPLTSNIFNFSYLFLLLQSTLIECSKISEEHTHKSLVSSRARITCNTVVAPFDSINLILWWKNRDATGPPFYTIDSRNRSLSSATHVINNSTFSGRIEFDINRTPAQLILSQLREDDAGNYTCRVDYKTHRTRYTTTHLIVQVPPKSLVIHDKDSDKILEKFSGPFNENSTLHLSCQALGGRPTPYLEWYINDQLIKSSESRYNPLSSITSSELTIKLERSYLKSRIKCVANIKDFLSVIVNEITIDLNLSPSNATIQFAKSSISAGNREVVDCYSFGSKPPAKITWYIDDVELNSTRLTTDESRLMSSSTLKFTPTEHHNGKYLICKAVNINFPHSPKIDQRMLNVYSKPHVDLLISNPKSYKDFFLEGETVVMKCNTSSSNPAVTLIEWYQDGRRIFKNPANGIFIEGEGFKIHPVGKKHIGRYHCIVSNIIGISESNGVFLNVLYTPQCKPGQKILYAFQPGKQVQVNCNVDANPPEVTFSWSQSQRNQLPSEWDYNIISNGLSSYLNFTSSISIETTVSCQARNSVGISKEPCLITLKPAGPPELPKNCSIRYDPSSFNKLTCLPGSNGGVDQNFVIEIHPSNDLDALIGERIANANPIFNLKGLEANKSYHVEIYAENALGRSRSLVIPFVNIFPATVSEYSIQSYQLSFLSIIVPIFLILGIFIISLFLLYKRKTNKEKFKANDSSTERCMSNKSPDLTCIMEEKLKKEESMTNLNKFVKNNGLSGLGSGTEVRIELENGPETGNGLSDGEDQALIRLPYHVSSKNAKNMEESVSAVDKLHSMAQDVSCSLPSFP